jgi:hypothetical protein
MQNSAKFPGKNASELCKIPQVNAAEFDNILRHSVHHWKKTSVGTLIAWWIQPTVQYKGRWPQTDTQLPHIHLAWNFSNTEFFLDHLYEYNFLKGTQDWDFFWLRFWNLYYFFISYVKILRFCKIFIGGDTIFPLSLRLSGIKFSLVWD